MRVIAAAMLVALFVVPVSSAKGPQSATVCGATGCVTLDEPPLVLASFGEGEPDRPPMPSAFYRVVLHGSEYGAGWLVWYVPDEGAGAFAGTGGRTAFERLDDPARRAFVRVTRGVAPFRAPIVTSASVDGRPVADPASYLRLSARPNELSSPPIAADWVTIELRSKIASPWTGGPPLLLSASTGVLQNGFSFSRLDPVTVERILARRSLGTIGAPKERPALARVATPVLVGVTAIVLLLVVTRLMGKLVRSQTPARHW